MMKDKIMVNDTLSMVNSSLGFYATSITECSNLELRSALQQIRNNCETTQYDLYKLAETKGFYKPATMANDSDVQQVKTELQG